MIFLRRDSRLIHESGLFMAGAYAGRHLGGWQRHRWALPHYLGIGERLGYWPNPFFDPVHAARGGVRGLADYLRRPALRDVAPSPLFDPAWYRRTAMEGAVDPHPLVHFWRCGFAGSADPSPEVDCAFFKDVVAVHRPDKEQVAYELLARANVAVPLNARDLRARQRRFCDAITIEIVKRRHGPPRPYLVFIQADATYRVPASSAERRYDRLVNCYDATPSPEAARDMGADIVVAQQGTKTTAIHTILERHPDLLLDYEAVLFLDDDIEIAPHDIERLFAIVAAKGLDLAQPTLTADSSTAFACLKQPAAETGLTALTAVEIMMPVLSRRALQTCGDAFGASVSGWGVDLLLAARVRARYGDTIALVGDVVAAHRRPVDTMDGAFYRFLAGYGLYADQELAMVARQYGTAVTPDSIRPLDPNPIATS